APVGPPAQLARAFEAPPERWAAGHRGVDLLAPAGADVVAPADGTVSFAGHVVDRGVVTVLHPDGRRSSVEPVVPLVAVGDVVRAGDRLGTVATGGHCAGTCLHWGVREGDRYVDPWSLLPGAGPVVLLPVP
ncbi:M23 family metallopeptidase, partial [Cellulomonas sp. 179-A 9B4 NHS]|uniref:M23 family metallopeptidase n=1 Tax=Cellulomonas sp. 179-A 9B4 NHS TaxID=3142379 RepID=UPI0039A328D3